MSDTPLYDLRQLVRNQLLLSMQLLADSEPDTIDWAISKGAVEAYKTVLHQIVEVSFERTD